MTTRRPSIRSILICIAGLVAVPLLLVCAALFGLVNVNANSDPSQMELAIASQALKASIVRQAPVAQSPFPPNTATILAGMTVYGHECEGCHGLAHDRAVYGLAFYPRAPQFAFQAPDLTDYQVYWVASNGIRYTGMQGMHGLMKDKNIWLAAEFVSHLRDLPPEVRAAWNAQK